MNRLLNLVFILPLILCSCHFFQGKKVRGDGNITTRERKVSGFSGVDVRGAFEVIVRQDSVYSVKVEADNNIHEYIEVYEQGGTLHIQPANNTNLDGTNKIKVYVSGPVFDHLEASGACDIVGNEMIHATEPVNISMSGASSIDIILRAPATKVKASGACSVKLKGETKDFTARGSGANDLSCYDLLAETTKIELSGAGDAEVYASVKLEADASGAASIKYKGPSTVISRTSGAGSVERQ